MRHAISSALSASRDDSLPFVVKRRPDPYAARHLESLARLEPRAEHARDEHRVRRAVGEAEADEPRRRAVKHRAERADLDESRGATDAVSAAQGGSSREIRTRDTSRDTSRDTWSSDLASNGQKRGWNKAGFVSRVAVVMPLALQKWRAACRVPLFEREFARDRSAR